MKSSLSLKKISAFVILILGASFFLASCSSEDSDMNTTETPTTSSSMHKMDSGKTMSGATHKDAVKNGMDDGTESQ